MAVLFYGRQKKGTLIMNKQINEKSGFAKAAFILGIIGVVLAFIPLLNIVSFPLGALAILFAIIPIFKKQSIAMAIVGLILGITSIAIPISMYSAVSDAVDEASENINQTMDDMSGDNTEEILKNDVQVDLSEFTVIPGAYGLDSSELVVSVRNKMTESKSFTIKIEAVDADGKRIDDDTVYSNDLGAGQAQDFKAFSLISSDKYEALQSATFKIISVSKI